MGSLPLWLQIIIGIISATNFIGFVTWFIENRRKDQEAKEARLQRFNDNLLQNTRNHIDPLYIPINRLISSLENKYDDYKIAGNRYYGYEAEKKLKFAHGRIEDQASIDLGLLLAKNKYDATQSFSNTIQELRDYQEKMISEGTTAYLSADFEKRFDAFIRFLYGVNVVIYTYLLSLKEGPIRQPKVYIPGEAEFEKELYGETDYIRGYIRNLALGLIDTTVIQAKK